MADEEKRPVRICESCGEVDDHPRHVYAQAAGAAPTPSAVAEKALRNARKEDWATILDQVRDDSVAYKHMDCCASDGCPDGSCNLVRRGAEDKKGNDLVKHLTSLPPLEELAKEN